VIVPKSSVIVCIVVRGAAGDMPSTLNLGVGQSLKLLLQVLYTVIRIAHANLLI